MTAVLLDTCALLWLAGNPGKLTPVARESMESASIIYVSAITGFEIGIKCQNRKLILPANPKDWFKTILDHHDITVIALSLELCLRATELPKIHNDPCDRMIIATAESHKIPVITADENFKLYGIQVIF